MRRLGTVVSLIGVLVALSFSATAQSSVTLAWNPSTSTGVTGYRVYYGVASRTYSSKMSVGNVTTASISGLTPGTTYYFAATDYDSLGNESGFSNETSFTVPGTPTTTPPSIVLSSPANGASYVAPATISLTASITANGHTITKVQFFNGATLLGESTAAPYSFTWSNVGVGSYSLSAQLVYDTSSTVSSAVANVTVANPQVSNGLTFAADSGTITAPFVVSAGTVYQTVNTTASTGGRAAYNIPITAAGHYTVSSVVYASNDSANSFYINIDSEPTDPTMIWDIPVAAAYTSQTVSWRGNGTDVSDAQYSPKVFYLPAGTHQLIVRGREANTVLGDITIVPALALPLPWQTADIGSAGVAGTASLSGSAYTLTGGGIINGTADNFRFAYQALSGRGEIKARIRSLQNTGTGGDIGVMIRETLTSGSQYAFMGVSPDGSFRSQGRASTGGSTSVVLSGTGAAPSLRVRLARSGNSLNSYKSTDGTNWTLVSSSKNVMANNIYIGLAVASGFSGTPNTSTFDTVTVVP